MTGNDGSSAGNEGKMTSIGGSSAGNDGAMAVHRPEMEVQ